MSLLYPVVMAGIESQHNSQIRNKSTQLANYSIALVPQLPLTLIAFI